jgi:predicted chitinase
MRVVSDRSLRFSASQIAFESGAAYWATNGLNEPADAGDFNTITRRINGALNRLDNWLKFYNIAKSVLGAGDKPGDLIAEAIN